MAPVASRVAHREEDRSAEPLCRFERLVAPWEPVHRVMGVLEQVGTGLEEQAIGVLRRPIGQKVARARFVARVAGSPGRIEGQNQFGVERRGAGERFSEHPAGSALRGSRVRAWHDSRASIRERTSLACIASRSHPWSPASCVGRRGPSATRKGQQRQNENSSRPRRPRNHFDSLLRRGMGFPLTLCKAISSIRADSPSKLTV